jgi:hypothetical protein
MRYYMALTEADLATIYIQAKGDPGILPDSAVGLVADVEKWLIASGMDHSMDDKVEIAFEAFGIAQEIRAQSLPDEAGAVLDV